jgi:N-acetylneuraminic acid mutarotase
MRVRRSPFSILWTAVLVVGLVALPLRAAGAVESSGAIAHPNDSGADTWAPTAKPMSLARSGHTATLLPDGKVLIVGGSTASAELYDPATRTFLPTGSMSVARPGATATLLPDGQVLVAGGCCKDNSNLASAELYNPTTGTWSLTGSMEHPRSSQTATLLPDGEVLVAGGACNGSGNNCDSGSSLVNQRTAELYDPQTGTWTLTGAMREGRDLATATLLQNGEVLVAGGFNSCDDDFCSDLAESELYNPATGMWQVTGKMHAAREQHTATLLPDGLVLVAGGLNEGGFGKGGKYSSAELYDPSSGTWTLTSPMQSNHYGQTATLLQSGWVLVAGGQSSAAEVYEPDRGIWVNVGSMSTTRTDATATLLESGDVLVTGGSGPDGQAQRTAEVFDATSGPLVSITPESLSFAGQQVDSTGAAKSYTVSNFGTAALVVSGVTISGTNPGDFTASDNCTRAPLDPGDTCNVRIRFSPTYTGLRSADVAVVDNAPSTSQSATVRGYGAGPNAFTPTGPMSVGRDSQTATLLRNGEVLVAGGEVDPGSPVKDAELYNPQTGTFRATGSLGEARSDATATLLPDGDVLVAGGKGNNAANLASAELYDPATGKWTATGSMNAAGYALASTLLPNGEVLVDGLGFGSSAEVYDPSTGMWSDTGPTSVSAFFGTTTLLPDREVLATGDNDTGATGLYDPSTNTWTTTGSLNVPRMTQTATLLPDGQVLIAGGDPPGGGSPLASAELYDPSTGVWTITGSMNTGRFQQTATLLSNGIVMVAGGCSASCGPVVASTEFYEGGYWYPGPSMTTPRYEDAATLLGDGNVLVEGGGTEYCCSVTATAEVYTPTLVNVSPSHGAAGRPITVAGSGFYAGEKVKVTFDFTTKIGVATTDAKGIFVLRTNVPSTSKAGTHDLEAFGESSFANARTTFTVS